MEKNMQNIKIKDINSLIEAEYNPRELTKEQHKQISDSIKRFGIVDPIIVNINKDRKNVIIGGHQRVKVAKDLNINKIPCIEIDLDANKERELNIRLNKNTGRWDYDILANCFDVDELLEFGWSNFEIENIKGVMPDDEDWADSFDKDTVPKELTGLKQFTFILKEEQITEIMDILKTIDKDKNIALYKKITE